jgi:hypothetical protein
MFEIGVAAPYILADALAGAIENAIDNMEIVKKARSGIVTNESHKDDNVIDVEFEVVK